MVVADAAGAVTSTKGMVVADAGGVVSSTTGGRLLGSVGGPSTAGTAGPQAVARSTTAIQCRTPRMVLA